MERERDKERKWQQLHAKPNNWSICIFHYYRCFDFSGIENVFLQTIQFIECATFTTPQFGQFDRKKILLGSTDAVSIILKGFKKNSIEAIIVFELHSY